MVENNTMYDLWSYPADARVITTNGFIKKNGHAVMGKGCAREARERFKDAEMILGAKIAEWGNEPYVFAFDGVYNGEDGTEREVAIVSFPVKHNFWEKADINLIRDSATRLVEITDNWHWDKVVMPRPGCGNGKLKWDDVKLVLESILDDRFVVVHK